MKNIIVLILLVIISSRLIAQIDSTWSKVIIEPDLLVYFPDTPVTYTALQNNSYEFQNDEVLLKVTSEKSPLIYFGRTIQEVNNEYFSSLTSKTIATNQKLIKETNFKFEGHNVRELVYLDTINSRPCTVRLQILNVTGFEEAMYKFYMIDFKNTNLEKYNKFFSNWDLYYKLENELNINKGNTDKVLKEKRFIIENERKNRKRRK